MGDPANQPLAAKLREMADVLAEQEADGFRISAYRRAANTIELLDRSVREIAETAGLPGLLELPSIGRGIGQAIMEMLSTRPWSQHCAAGHARAGAAVPDLTWDRARTGGTAPRGAARRHARGPGACGARRSAKCPGSAGGAQLPFAPSSASGWTTGASRRPSRQKCRPQRSSLTSIMNTGRRRTLESCAPLHPNASIPQARPGCPCFTPREAIGASPLSTQHAQSP